MAKYKAEPFYSVNLDKQKVVFDYFGNYETDNEAEIEALDELSPKWIKRVDASVASQVEPEHIGGGYYMLSNGEKVKGKEAAIEAEAKIQK